MPKKAKSRAQKLNHVVQRYHDEFHKTSLNLLWCKLCDKRVSFTRKHSIVSHRSTMIHHTKISSSDEHESKTPLAKSSFPIELVRTFLELDIPLHKLRAPQFQKLLRKFELPEVSHSKAHSLVKTIAEEK